MFSERGLTDKMSPTVPQFFERLFCCLALSAFLPLSVGHEILREMEKEGLHASRFTSKVYEVTVPMQIGKEECFYQPTPKETMLKTLFMTRLSVKATFRDPVGKVILETTDSDKLFYSNLTIEGDYEFCFTTLSREEHNMRFVIAILDEESILRHYDDGRKEFSEELKSIWKTVSFIRKRVNRMGIESLYHLRYINEDEEEALRLRRLVDYWSCAQCVLVVLAGVAQVRALRYILDPATPMITPPRL